MIETRLNRLLGIRYPILQGGMFWLATAELAAAVSNAGGLGVISPYASIDGQGDPAENLRRQIARVRSLTDRPWGVNLLLDIDVDGLLADVLLREKAPIVVTAAGDPGRYTGLFKANGLRVLHVVASVRQARQAEACGADAVVAEGVEAAAHVGYDEIPLFSLLPQVVDAVAIPVVAAGGIADSRGLAAAIALGAEGVQLGTRFVAAAENIAHERYKQAICAAGDADTAVTCRRLVPTRGLRTPLSRRIQELEADGATGEALRAFIGRGRDRDRRGQIDGDLAEGLASCGASAGLVREILPAAEVIRRLVEGYPAVLRRMA
jgi:enoyl-[acyl-carrier protein] reductase II